MADNKLALIIEGGEKVEKVMTKGQRKYILIHNTNVLIII